VVTLTRRPVNKRHRASWGIGSRQPTHSDNGPSGACEHCVGHKGDSEGIVRTGKRCGLANSFLTKQGRVDLERLCVALSGHLPVSGQVVPPHRTCRHCIPRK